MVEFDSIGATAVKGDEGGDIGVGLVMGSLFAFPQFDDIVPTPLEESQFVVDELTDVIHGLIQ